MKKNSSSSSSSSSSSHIHNNQLKSRKFLWNKISKAYYKSCFFVGSLAGSTQTLNRSERWFWVCVCVWPRFVVSSTHTQTQNHRSERFRVCVEPAARTAELRIMLGFNILRYKILIILIVVFSRFQIWKI